MQQNNNTPKDHTSAICPSYPIFYITSGAK